MHRKVNLISDRTSKYKIKRGEIVKLWILILWAAALGPMCTSNAISVAAGAFEEPANNHIYPPEILGFDKGQSPSASDALAQQLSNQPPSSYAKAKCEDSNMHGNNGYPGSYLKATLDRIEGDIAVLLIRDDERIRIDLPVSLLPEGSKEGDILDITLQRDQNETEQARARTSDLIEKLKRKNSTAR